MRTTLEPRLVDPTGGEPGLVVDVRDERRALLFDLGSISQLAPRTLLRATHAFVSHTHMDHFAGFDHLLALGLGRMPRLVLWGGPGFCDRVEHKLQAYTWNVVHRYEVPMVIEAHAVGDDGRRVLACFDSRHGFVRSEGDGGRVGREDGDGSWSHGGIAGTRGNDRSTSDDGIERQGGPAVEGAGRGRAVDQLAGLAVHRLLDDPLFGVRACIVDHEMPVLAFAIDETAQLRVAADRIAAMGLATGPWLRSLKQAVLAGAGDETPIDVTWRDAGGEHTRRHALGELRPLVLDTVPGRTIGYVTDLRWSEANQRQLEALLSGVDLLYIEAVFLDADRAHAARKNHLTARQAGAIARRLCARKVMPFHFSPRYRGREQALRDEVLAAWQGA